MGLYVKHETSEFLWCRICEETLENISSKMASNFAYVPSVSLTENGLTASGSANGLLSKSDILFTDSLYSNAKFNSQMSLKRKHLTTQYLEIYFRIRMRRKVRSHVYNVMNENQYYGILKWYSSYSLLILHSRGYIHSSSCVCL